MPTSRAATSLARVPATRNPIGPICGREWYRLSETKARRRPQGAMLNTVQIGGGDGRSAESRQRLNPLATGHEPPPGLPRASPRYLHCIGAMLLSPLRRLQENEPTIQCMVCFKG